MANAFPGLVAIAAVGWLIADAASSQKPDPPPLRAVAGPSMPLTVRASRSIVLEARRDPVPLVRPRSVAVVQEAPPPPAPRAATASPDGLDRSAARAAAEADGYKRVTVLDKESDGVWRAKGYRGTTEVLLAVDSRGRVFSR